jgi:hypothetical protein
MNIYNIDSKLSFGKYKGKTILEVVTQPNIDAYVEAMTHHCKLVTGNSMLIQGNVNHKIVIMPKPTKIWHNKDELKIFITWDTILEEQIANLHKVMFAKRNEAIEMSRINVDFLLTHFHIQPHSVFGTDGNYIEWCIKTIPDFCLSEQAILSLETTATTTIDLHKGELLTNGFYYNIIHSTYYFKFSDEIKAINRQKLC